MATARQHLSNNHQQEQSHWSTFAKGLTELGTHVRALYKEAGMKSDCKAGDAIDKLAAAAQNHAEYHGTQAEACMKAVDGDLNKLIPTEVSVVAPDRPNTRLVPRAGGPSLQQAAVDENVRKVLGLGPEDQDGEEASLVW